MRPETSSAARLRTIPSWVPRISRLDEQDLATLPPSRAFPQRDITKLDRDKTVTRKTRLVFNHQTRRMDYASKSEANTFDNSLGCGDLGLLLTRLHQRPNKFSCLPSVFSTPTAPDQSNAPPQNNLTPQTGVRSVTVLHRQPRGARQPQQRVIASPSTSQFASG